MSPLSYGIDPCGKSNKIWRTKQTEIQIWKQILNSKRIWQKRKNEKNEFLEHSLSSKCLISAVQWPSHNRITLDQYKSDNNNQIFNQIFKKNLAKTEKKFKQLIVESFFKFKNVYFGQNSGHRRITLDQYKSDINISMIACIIRLSLFTAHVQ